MTKAEIKLKSNVVKALRKALYAVVQTEEGERIIEIIYELCDELSKEM